MSSGQLDASADDASVSVVKCIICGTDDTGVLRNGFSVITVGVGDGVRLCKTDFLTLGSSFPETITDIRSDC